MSIAMPKKSVLLLLLCPVFCAVVRKGGTMQLLHVALLLSCPSSSMSHRKFEGRREKGIEGMSWGKDNQGGILLLICWQTVFGLSMLLVSLLSFPFL